MGCSFEVWDSVSLVPAPRTSPHRSLEVGPGRYGGTASGAPGRARLKGFATSGATHVLRPEGGIAPGSQLPYEISRWKIHATMRSSPPPSLEANHQDLKPHRQLRRTAFLSRGGESQPAGRGGSNDEVIRRR